VDDNVRQGEEMKTMSTLLLLLAALPAIADPVKDSEEPKTDAVCLAEVTVTARPTGMRHQSYVFTLKSKKADSSWTFELAQDVGGGVLLYIAGNRTRLDDEKELQSWHHKSTVLKLQRIEPQKAVTGQILTHRMLSLTWGQQEPNTTSDGIRQPADGSPKPSR
jgi:hypothetical protein